MSYLYDFILLGNTFEERKLTQCTLTGLCKFTQRNPAQNQNRRYNFLDF